MESNGRKQDFPDSGSKQKDMLSKERFGKYFLLAVFALSFGAFLYVIRIFIVDIILAIVLATLFFPFFKGVLKIFRNKHGVSAFLTCITILLVLLIPLIFISNIVIMQSIDLYHSAGPQLKQLVQKDVALINKIKDSPVGQLLAVFDIDWQEAINNVVNYLGLSLAKIINKTSKTTFTVILDIFVTLFSTFYFLKDGQRILSIIRSSIPLNEEYKNDIINKFSMILNATVKGVLLIALIQSFLGTIALWACGVKAWLLWGGIMFILATVPFVGTGFVLVPFGVIRIVNGDLGSGIALILISLFFISLIDNFLRPRIVGHYSGMHDLLIFFGIIGGISVFGPAGIVLGPIILSIFVTVLEIYNIEFYEHIKYSKSKGAGAKIEEKQSKNKNI